MKVSLYIHIPFCIEKCSYCDFFSVPYTGSEQISLVLDKIIDEILQKLALIPEPEINTIFIGGGTPSVIPPAQFYNFLERLNQRLCGNTIYTPDKCEYSIEANIESCSSEFIEAITAGGINRLSLGVQSFDHSVLKKIGRACYPEDIEGRVADIASRWKGRLSIDIISGVSPSCIDDIKTALNFEPEHMSVYQLTIEEHTKLAEMVEKGAGSPVNEQLQTWAITAVNRIMTEKGYKRYEISNYAKPGQECRHNLTYWDMQSYIGTGPSAVSSIYIPENRIRLTNPKNIKKWAEGDFEKEVLSEIDFLIEHFIMGCRLTDGIDLRTFEKRFGAVPSTFIPRTAERWYKRGLFNPQDCFLNEDGLLLLDSFLSDVYSELTQNK